MPTFLAMRVLVALLGCAVVVSVSASSAGAYRLAGGRWSPPTISYYTETAAYRWSVDTAAYAWNSSGANVRFVKTSRAHAQVLVGIRWYKLAGDARIEGVNSRILSAKVGIQSGHDRYETALIVAHELGHVLGLDHETHRCATMNSSVGDDHTTLCPAPPAGEWTCRLLQLDDVRGAVAIYGGTVRPWRGSSFCAR
jgi:hypothetical protein